MSLVAVFHGEADLEQHLVEMDLAVGDLAARLDHLEPAEIPHGFGGTGDRRC